MSHYFTKDNNNLKSQEKDIYVHIKDKKFHFITDNGVFSKSGLDFGSRLLIESVVGMKKTKVLDLGCGYGPIGIIYKSFNPEAEVIMTDINIRASELTKKNATLNQVDVMSVNGDGFSEITGKFDMILTNPPIRTGKENIYKLFQESYEHLLPGGELIYVMHKKHGVASAIRKCEEIYKKVDVFSKKSGYHIIKCII